MTTAMITLTYILIFLAGASSFLFLNVCPGPLSARHVLAALLGGLAAVACVLKYGYTLQAVIVFAFFATITVIAIVDMDTMKIPNSFVITVLIIGVMSILAFPEIGLLQRGIGLVAVSGPLLIITLMVPGAFGGGDIKLMAASGIFLGWKLNLIALVLAILTGGAYGIYLLATRKKSRKEHFAFGPFLCIGMAAALLWGEQIWNHFF